MEKITKQDIYLLTEYFSSGEVESLKSEALEDFANALNAIFKAQPFDEAVLNNFLVDNGATDFKNEILAIKNDYKFQIDIQQSFKQLEREKLKKKFLAIDSDEVENDLSGKEISAAFQQIERANLKAKFKEIDEQKSEGEIIKFNWQRFAIAASLVGVILMAGFYFFNSNKPDQQLATHDTTKQPKDMPSSKQLEQYDNIISYAPMNSIPENLKDFSKILADNRLKTIKKDLPINNPSEMGFISKQVHFENYILQPRIDTLQKIISYLKINKGDLVNIKRVENTLDSLNNLNFKYTFTANKLKLYSYKAIKAEIFENNAKLTISIQNKDYTFKETKTLKILK